MTDVTNHKIDTKFLFELLKNLDDMYEAYFQNVITLCVKTQLNKLNKSETIEHVSIMLNQTLDICLRNEQVKRAIINVIFSFSS